MSQLELLEKTIRSLEKEKIPYMLTGSLVSSFQGNPRSTHDYWSKELGIENLYMKMISDAEIDDGD